MGERGLLFVQPFFIAAMIESSQVKLLQLVFEILKYHRYLLSEALPHPVVCTCILRKTAYRAGLQGRPY